MAVLKTTSPWPSSSAPSAWPEKTRPSSRTSAANAFRALAKDHRLVNAFDLVQQHGDLLGFGGGRILAYVVRPDRELAVAPVDQHRELDRTRPSQLDERVQRGPRRPAMVDDVVNQHHRLAVDVRHVGGPRLARSAQVQVVAMAAGVET